MDCDKTPDFAGPALTDASASALMREAGGRPEWKQKKGTVFADSTAGGGATDCDSLDVLWPK